MVSVCSFLLCRNSEMSYRGRVLELRIANCAFPVTWTDKPHPWISIAMGALRQGALADTLKRFPTAAQVFLAFFPSKIAKLTEETRQNENLAIELTKKRIERHDSARKDFMTRILEQRDPAKVSDLQLAAHASEFVIAGSETSATALACILFHLIKDPTVMAKLCSEVRSGFQFYKDICSHSTLPLPYLKAVILEGLRIYPPLPFALPRVVPEGGDTVDGIYLPAGVSTIMDSSQGESFACVSHAANDTASSDHCEHKSGGGEPIVQEF